MEEVDPDGRAEQMKAGAGIFRPCGNDENMLATV